MSCDYQVLLLLADVNPIYIYMPIMFNLKIWDINGDPLFHSLCLTDERVNICLTDERVKLTLHWSSPDPVLVIRPVYSAPSVKRVKTTETGFSKFCIYFFPGRVVI